MYFRLQYSIRDNINNNIKNEKMNKTMGCVQLLCLLVICFTWFSTSESLASNIGFATKSTTTENLVSFLLKILKSCPRFTLITEIQFYEIKGV